MVLLKRAEELSREAAALFLAMKRPDTPFAAKLAAALAVGYALSPIDLVPDFIPVLGYLDDLLLLPAMVALAVRLVPAGVMEQCRMQAAGLWQDGKPKRWIYALPIAILWTAVLLFVIWRIGVALR